jgi:hypothetical protein
MVIHDFDVGSLSVMPDEADAVPLVDSDTVLADTVFPKHLELKLPETGGRAGQKFCSL